MPKSENSIEPFADERDQLRQEIKALKATQQERERILKASLHHEYALREAENAVRVQVASMDLPQHLCRVVEEIGTQLQHIGIDHDSCCIQVVNEAGSDFVSFASYIHEEWYDEIMTFVHTGSRGELESHAKLYPWVIDVWKSGVPRYVGCTEINGRGITISDISLIDVPFSHGTLAVNKKRTDAFTPQDIAVLRNFAKVLNEGFQRFLYIVERQKSEQQIQNSLREKEVLLREVHHRVKNNLQTIASLLSLQAAGLADEEARQQLLNSQNRVHSMALIHETLYRSTDLGRVNLAQYIPELAVNVYESMHLNAYAVHMDIQVEDIYAKIDPAISCALIVNELMTNALKYAFTPNDQGVLGIEIKREQGDTVLLKVWDNGVGVPADLDIEHGQSLGLRIVSSLVRQLRGSMQLNRERGTEWVIHFSLP